jgi:cation diffusion facilitator family transporter
VAAETSSKTVVVVALIANGLVTLTKFAAALFTGSSAMLSEAVHSLVDAGNEGLLLYGQHRADLPPSELHPLGHGREVYFWSFIVALLIFGLGAGVSIYEGITHILYPEPIQNPVVNYIVLAAAFVFDSFSWVVAFRAFRAAKGSLGWFEAIVKSKDPPGFIVLLEDSADLIGIALAFAGIFASTALHMPVLDGVASIAIGLLLTAVAAVLARESKNLLIGERADPEIVASMLALAGQTPGVMRARELFTIHIGPEQIVAALSVDFDDRINAGEVEAIVAKLDKDIRTAHPEVTNVLIKPEGTEAETMKSPV